ncbi:hypothetical protein VPH35_051698 [Triticum aestivum]
MANFALDPQHYVPVGHHIIDGGAHRLPCTFVSPPSPIVRSHESFMIVEVMPVPPLLQMGQGFRGVQGFHDGCLMFLGVPLDLRNTENLRAAVNTFGQFHHWVSDDPYLVRSIVFASFPEDFLVPRDQMPQDEDPMPIDGNPHPLPGHLIHEDNLFALPPYPALGWNDVPPPPHPMDDNQGGGWGWHANEQNAQEVPVQVELAPDQESMVINQQDFSGSISQSVSQVPDDPIVHDVEIVQGPAVIVQVPVDIGNVALDAQLDVAPVELVLVGGDLQIGIQPAVDVDENFIQMHEALVDPDALAIVPYQPPVLLQQNLVVGRVHVAYGPPLPPEMAWRRTFGTLLGRCSTLQVPKPVLQSSFGSLVLSKRSWSLAFEKDHWVSDFITDYSASMVAPLSALPPPRGLARDLFPDSQMELEHDSGLHEQISFSAPSLKKKKAPKRSCPPVVDSELRRCTRSSAKRDGFKPVLQALPMSEPKKKKPRSKPLMDDGSASRMPLVPPPTPIRHIQQIGADLGISAEKLSVDALMADPSSTKVKSSHD